MRKIVYKKGRKVQPLHFEYTGLHKNNDSEMQLFVYNDTDLTEYEKIEVADFDQSLIRQKTNWINIHGLNNIELLQSVGNYFEIDTYMLADILNTTKSGTLEFNSRFSSKVSNQFLATFTRNQATRQYDSVFPSIDIFDGTTGNNIVSAGMDPYTYNNDVINKVYSFTNNLSFYLGKHTLTTGLTYEFQEVGNMFMAASNSYYVFNSIDDLVNDIHVKSTNNRN